MGAGRRLLRYSYVNGDVLSNSEVKLHALFESSYLVGVVDVGKKR